MTLLRLEGLEIGELGTERSQNVVESVSTAKISYSSDGVSQFDFSVSDPELKLHNNGYFVIRRQVRYLGRNWEMAAIEVNANKESSVDITCRSEAAQRIKRDKGGTNFGAISPTSFAAQIAAKFGLEFFGESSPAKEAITRTQNERTDESSWDVLKRLAGDLEFEMFEAEGLLYFSSRKNLMAKQPTFHLDWPSPENSSMPVYDLALRRSDDDPLGATLTAEVDRTNGIQLRPGMRTRIRGIAFYEMDFMVERVDWDEGSPKPVKISAATLQDTEDTGCETRVFKLGDKNVCVKRIQQAMKVPWTGIFDEPTETAVKAFQLANELPSTGIVNLPTWAKIRANV